MIQLSQSRMKRLTAIHGWSGVVLGLLLYAVIATGAVAVFAEEIGRWSSGMVRQHDAFERPIDARVRSLAREVDPAFRHDVGIWGGSGNDLNLFFHEHRWNPDEGHEDDYGTIFRIDGDSGAVLSRSDGFIWQQPEAYETSALRQFFVDLHVQLYVPSPWGLVLTGVLGLMMMAAVTTGVLIHRHLIRDLFLAERPGGRISAVRDRHALSASWNIPFAFLLAFTGSFFSFAGTIAFPLVAQVAFDGEEDAMSKALFEAPATEDTTASPLASLDYILADSTARAGGPATYVGISDYGRADARVHIWHLPSEGALIDVQNVYAGPTRQFLGSRPVVGNAPSAGGTLYGLMSPLHFGNFAGLASKAVWGALGVAMCFVTLSGFRLWVRRRSDSTLWRGFGRAVQATGYGVPLAMITSAYAFFLSRPTGDTFWWTPFGFLPGAALAIWLGLRIADEDRLGRAFQRLLGTLCVALPVIRLGSGGMTWADALIWRQYDVMTIDLLLAIAGAVLWYISPPLRTRPSAVMAPAE